MALRFIVILRSVKMTHPAAWRERPDTREHDVSKAAIRGKRILVAGGARNLGGMIARGLAAQGRPRSRADASRPIPPGNLRAS